MGRRRPSTTCARSRTGLSLLALLPVSLLAVTFTGILTVTDKMRFRKTLMEGIGRGKAFGMGLLTVIKLRGNAHE